MISRKEKKRNEEKEKDKKKEEQREKGEKQAEGKAAVQLSNDVFVFSRGTGDTRIVTFLGGRRRLVSS